MVRTGLDILILNTSRLKGKRVGLVCNQASISAELDHALHLLHHALEPGQLRAIFGPQHGLWGHTQDNMIEWEGGIDPETGVKVFSLYGQHRKPTPEMLDGLDALIFDVPEVGARYYTFIWTLAYVLEACEPLGIEVIVLDRPNPIGAHRFEGPYLDPEFKSFVGLYPLPCRHGMTMAELALLFKSRYFHNVRLTIIPMEGWHRNLHFDQTGLFFAMPSPNMPSPDTALVYPGMCLIEGTKMSEGRGTTHPFEMFGAPYIQGRPLCRELNSEGLPGVHFRAVAFQPTNQKHSGELCEGAFIHVTDREAFEPVMTALWLMREMIRMYGEHWQWQDPPYEYEFEKLPIDILFGNAVLRPMLESGAYLRDIRAWIHEDSQPFAKERADHMIYS